MTKGNCNNVEYNKDGHRIIKLPEWTKTLNDRAVMKIGELRDILGFTSASGIYRMVREGKFPEGDSITNNISKYRCKGSHGGKSQAWSLKLLRSLENK